MQSVTQYRITHPVRQVPTSAKYIYIINAKRDVTALILGLAGVTTDLNKKGSDDNNKKNNEKEKKKEENHKEEDDQFSMDI